MEQNVTKNLNNLTRMLGADRLLTPEDVTAILTGIMQILAEYKKGTEGINEETKQVVNTLLDQVVKYNNETITDFKTEAEKAHGERIKELEILLRDLKTMVLDVEVLASNVRDGKDADEERVIGEVISRIKIDPTVITVSAQEIRDKLASLKDEDRLDKSAIKGLEKILMQKDLDYAIATLQQQTSFLINKGGLKTVSHDASLSGDGTPENPLSVESTSGLTLETDGVANGSQTLLNLVGGTNVTLTDNGTGSVTIDATGGSGTPGGSDTQIQFNDGGSFGGDANFVWDKTNDRLGIGTSSPSFILHAKGSTSGGFAKFERTTASTTGLAGVTIYEAASSGDMADTFGVQLSLNIKDDAGVTNQIGVIGAVRNGADNTGYITFQSANAGTVAARVRVDHTSLAPATSDGLPLGTTSLMWADLFLASGAVINFNNGDVTLTHSSNTLTLAGGILALPSSGVSINGTTVTSTGTQLNYLNAATGITGTASTNIVFSTSPDLTTPDINDATVDSLTAGTTSGGVALKNNAGTTVASFGVGSSSSTNISLAGTVALGTNSLTMTGSIAATGSRVTKVWATDIESTNMPTVGGTAILTSLTAPQFTTIELGNASDTTLSRSAAGQLAVEGVDVLTTSNTKTVTNKTLTTPVINGATLNGDLQTDGLPDTDDTWNGKSTNSFNAAGTIAQFDCVYMTSSSTWALTDADAIGTAGNVLVMMAGAAGTVSNPLRVIEPGSWVRNDAWNWTVGGVLYLDTATPGGMTQTAPSGEDDAVKIVGHAVSADVIYFNPSVNWIIYKA